VIGDANDAKPHLREDLPPPVVASPSEIRADPEQLQWWRPGWQDAVRFVGWRWILLSPAIFCLIAAVGGWWFAGWRTPLLLLGGKFLFFAGAVAMSLAGYVIRVAARARKEPFCIHCGYNLTGLPDDYRCPECGRPYNWRLIEEYRRDPQWFIERWRMHQDLPAAEPPFQAGPVRVKPNDGTE